MALGIVVLFCAAMILAGAVGFAAPPRLLAYAVRWKAPRRLVLATVLRVVFGVALFLVADASRAPTAFRVFGGIAVAAGLVIPLLGTGRIGRMIDYWRQRPPGVIRLWCGSVVLVGALLLYGALPSSGG